MSRLKYPALRNNVHIIINGRFKKNDTYNPSRPWRPGANKPGMGGSGLPGKPNYPGGSEGGSNGLPNGSYIDGGVDVLNQSNDINVGVQLVKYNSPFNGQYCSVPGNILDFMNFVYYHIDSDQIGTEFISEPIKYESMCDLFSDDQGIYEYHIANYGIKYTTFFEVLSRKYRIPFYKKENATKEYLNAAKNIENIISNISDQIIETKESLMRILIEDDSIIHSLLRETTKMEDIKSLC